MLRHETGAARELELDPAQDPFSEDSIRHLVQRYGSPLLVIDAERVRGQYRRLAAALPGVDLHYALKPLPHQSVVETLLAQGAYFDLASNGEIDMVRRARVAPDRCIHTHPIKRDGDIRTALAFGVRIFVVDNEDEVRKFAQVRHRAELLIRISFRSPDAVCDLSRKFGCGPEAAEELMSLAAGLGIRVAGLSFHVGSQASGPDTHVEAIRACAGLLRRAAARGLHMRILDIGG